MPESEPSSRLTTEEAVTALERFVVDNDELLELEAQVGRFNIFDALGIARAEIRHSAYLRWLLDPSESHGLGPMFLRPVLMDILRGTPDEKRPLSPIDLDGVELRGVEVSSERERIDILITCDDPPFVVAIENKVDSGEHSGQLGRYRETVRRLFPGREALFVYLTREGEEPSDEAWTPYSYRDVHRVMERVERTNEGAIGDDVRVFLDHYLSLLRSRFMDDPTIDALVEKIYKQHRQALEVIFARRPDVQSEIAERVRVLATEHFADCEVYSTRKAVFLCPKRWLDLLPPCGVGTKYFGERSWMWLEIRTYRSTMEGTLFISRTEPIEHQRDLYARIRASPGALVNPSDKAVGNNAHDIVKNKRIASGLDAQDYDPEKAVTAFEKKIPFFRGWLDAATDAIEGAFA